MNPKINGGGQTRAERIARLEQQLNRWLDDQQKRENPKPVDGFKHFLKTNVMGRRN